MGTKQNLIYIKTRHASGVSQSQIARELGITHGRVWQIINDWKKTPEHWTRTGREYVRGLVRKRDKYRCRSCGKKQIGRAFHVHHLNGMCGKNSRGYDSIKDIDTLITLCPLCHHNHPEFSLNLKKNKK